MDFFGLKKESEPNLDYRSN